VTTIPAISKLCGILVDRGQGGILARKAQTAERGQWNVVDMPASAQG
jgi:hypothetical protein